jgi:multidrug transporter EmrE-like cation transporter
MSLLDIGALSLVEIVGDFGLKDFANNGGIRGLATGIGGYIGVVYFLIRSFQGSTILLVNASWDGINTLIEAIAAYFILGERFETIWEYIGLFLIIIGLLLFRIPIRRKTKFKFPDIFK